MNLLDVYKSLLSTAGMSADTDGFISIRLAGTEKKPFLVKGKRLVLPIEEQLRNSNFENRIVFHPLSESILRGESEVVTGFREALVKRLNFIIGYLSVSLLDLAVSTAVHSRFTPQQTEFLAKVKDTDEKTVQCLQKITELMMVGDTSRTFVHLRVQKNGTVGNSKHRRVGIAYFPFYEEVKKVPAPKEANEIYGVKLRKNDRETFKVLMEYIISGIENTNSWMFPSDSEIAPTMDALMKTLIAISDPINTTVDLFKDYVDGSEDLYFNGDWEESFSDLNKLHVQIRMIPMQPGNEGRIPPTGSNVISVDTALTPTQSATSNPKPHQLGQVVETTKPAIKPPSGGLAGLAVDEQSSRAVAPQQHPLQPVNQQPVQPSWVAPSPMGYSPQVYNPYQPQQPVQPQVIPGTVVVIQTPMGPQQMMVNQTGQLVPLQQMNQYPPQVPQVHHTGRGLDFNSVMAANPHIAAQTAMQNPMMGYNNMQQGMQQRPSMPSWARPNMIGNV